MNIRNYVFMNQLVLKFVGLYPISIIRYFICVSCVMLIIIPQIVMIYTNWYDLNTIMETSSDLLTLSLAILKSVVWIFNRKKLTFFIEFMLTDYWKIIDSNVFEYLQEYAIYAKNITKAYFISMCNALLFFYSLPIIEIFSPKNKDSGNFTTRSLPFVASYPMVFYKFPFYETLKEQSKLIKYLSYLIVSFFQLSLFCFPGDMLMQQSFSISTAVYSIQWSQLPTFVKDEVCMIILRSQKPSCITAGKIYVMHLENFLAILSTAFSYFMTLQNFSSGA
ncbi:Odorant receptor 85e [Eufriesea mexicana]|uniref:Odorant receptor 85e n=1 Tax=Eufriesea mexicana TaxID=516756 RepID=A0A310SKQ0_9HYME|nr:Odorant receptor 85e [Eufriesea mexicana]